MTCEILSRRVEPLGADMYGPAPNTDTCEIARIRRLIMVLDVANVESLLAIWGDSIG